MGLFLVLLTVLFVGLKLCAVIAWSWLWVLAPLWLGLLWAVVLIVITIAVAVSLAPKKHATL